MAKILYLSYDGLTDPLGQAQILPYLEGLRVKGHPISIISFEKRAFAKRIGDVKRITDHAGIEWIPLTYHKRPPIFSTLWDILHMYRCARQMMQGSAIEIIHFRSYLPGLVALALKRRKSVHIIFDTRGFWIDERIEGGIWNPKNPFYRIITFYLRGKEKELYQKADSIVVLTSKAKKLLISGSPASAKEEKIKVIPCCVDLEFFSRYKLGGNKQSKWFEKLGIHASDKIIIYHGSLGTWYMANEMLDFFLEGTRNDPTYFFLVVTPDDPQIILQHAQKIGVPANRISIYKATREEIPSLLRLSHLAIFFIKPVFSKSASSPTKLGELISMELPIITNAHVGDNDELLRDQQNVFFIEDFSSHHYQKVLNQLTDFIPSKYNPELANYFSLSNGVNAYHDLYQTLSK